MPAKNIVKTFIENGYYHIYNRGVEKRSIFLDQQDCIMFLHYLKLYLCSVEELPTLTEGRHMNRLIQLNLSKEVDLLAFALMPNHIHLEIKQHTKDGISKLMRRVATSYVMYFNRKYKRIGPLFQNIYKGAFIDRDEYLLHLSRYIHLNPIKLQRPKINFLSFSSYPYYLGLKQASWVKPKEIVDYFSIKKGDFGSNSYKDFVEGYNEDAQEMLEDLILEEDNEM